MKNGRDFTVRQVAALAGVSVRALHHYDALGLLAPARRSGAGYRLYGEKELLRLQQILFYREMAMPLGKIAAMLDAADFDISQALREHRAALKKRILHTQRLLRTIDTTLRRLKRKGETDMDEKEILALYAGFGKEEALAMHREAEQRWGGTDAWAEAKQKTQKMSKEKFAAINLAADAAQRGILALRDRPVSDPAVQALVAKHFQWILNFWTPDRHSYKALGQMYADDPRFRAFYEKYGRDFADYLAAAMAYYADHTLAVRR